MSTATLSCFVGLLLFAPTLGLLWFVANDPIRADDYELSDLKTVFARISVDLAAVQEVLIVAPRTAFTPPVGTTFDFSTNLRDPNNNWIDEATGSPYEYVIGGDFSDIDVEQGLIHVVAFNTVEDIYEGEPSLTMDLTIRMEYMNLYSNINCNGTWRTHNLEVSGQFFDATYDDLEVRYRTRFNVRPGAGSSAGQWFLGQSIGQSVITVNHVNVSSIRIENNDNGDTLHWEREGANDVEHVNEMARVIITSALRHAVDPMDSFLRLAFANRPYVAPGISVVIAAANSSGYSCRRPPSRIRRNAKLYD